MRITKKGSLILLPPLIILALFSCFFYIFDWKEKLNISDLNIFKKSQTIGAITVDRGVDQIKITEINNIFWNVNTISPVIGKPYKIDQIKNDAKSVHLEFAYNPKEIPAGISPTDLRLYKWHDENGKKYWSLIKSQVDTSKHIITADLKTFSIIAIKAPVWLVLNEREKNDLNKTLNEMQKNPPPFACGVTMTMEEELISGDFYYSRSGDENIEKHGCWNNDDVVSVPFDYQIAREENGETKAYYAKALVEWQIDQKESIILDGWVVNQNGEAVKDAQIIAQKEIYDSWEQKTTTNENGYYKLKLRSGQYTVKVTSKDSKCPIVSTGNQFCYQGDISEEPFIQSHWQKNFTLKKCGKYELIITSKIKDTNYYSEVHGKALLDEASGASSGIITIDKMTVEYQKGGTCKQLRPFQYDFKAIGSNLNDIKNLSISLDFNEQNEKPLPEEAFCMNTILIPNGSPSSEAEIQKKLNQARQYCDFECNYISDYANYPGIDITEDMWLFDFISMHADEGTSGTYKEFPAIINIKDWEIAGQKGVWARKYYQREKQVLNGTYVEDTVLELKALD